MMQCPRCHRDVRTVFYDKAGDARCVGCKSLEENIVVTSAVFRDEIPGGLTVENYGPKPITFYSHTERRAYMAQHGLVEKEKFCPMPGTDIDPQGIPNPKGYMDPQTLENARVLLSRNGARATEEHWDGVESGVLTMQQGHLTERDAKAIAAGDTRRMSRFARRTEK